MRAPNKDIVTLVVGLTACALVAGQAEARNGQNAAFIGGAVAGALAGAVIANAAEAQTYSAGWDGYGYGQPDYYVEPRYVPRYTYRRAYRPAYVYVEPAPTYGSYDYRQPYRDDWRWRRPHHWHHWHDDGGGNWGGGDDHGD